MDVLANVRNILVLSIIKLISLSIKQTSFFGNWKNACAKTLDNT